MKVFFGIDIGGTQIKFGVFSEKAKLLQKWSVKTDLSEAGSRIIPQVGKEVRNWLQKQGLTEKSVNGIGLGIPGPVDEKGYVRTCVNLNWHDFYPAIELGKEFPDAVITAGNDANVAALGEYMQGAGKRYSSAMLITIGTGIGGGIILNGKIVSGAHGIAGEIGHITTDSEATGACNCGNTGCVDHIASATGIARRMKELLAQNKENHALRGKDFTAKDVCDKAAEGDALCIRCIEQCMEPLGKAMAFFSHAFDPQVFIIGGGVSRAGDIILEPLRKFYQKNLYLIREGADIRTAQLGNDAGMIGSCMMAMDKASETERQRI